MVLTTRHHEGFSLWDSKVNPFNSVNYGPKRDIVREFVDACHEFGMKVGFYSSLMDWKHPDGGRCAYDLEARIRFNKYIMEMCIRDRDSTFPGGTAVDLKRDSRAAVRAVAKGGEDDGENTCIH